METKGNEEERRQRGRDGKDVFEAWISVGVSSGLASARSAQLARRARRQRDDA